MDSAYRLDECNTINYIRFFFALLIVVSYLAFKNHLTKDLSLKGLLYTSDCIKAALKAKRKQYKAMMNQVFENENSSTHFISAFCF